MAFGLTATPEERLDGAPSQGLPSYEDRVNQLALYLVSEDAEGALYGGDPANARGDAIRMLRQEVEAERAQADQMRAQGQQQAAQASAARRAQRAAAQGVVPEDLPADEFGNVSPRTVQDANKPLDVQEAELEEYQRVAGAEIRDLREGRLHGAAARQRQYAQDYGLGVQKSRTGKTDLDYINKIQKRQGFMRLGTGEVIPLGRPPTPEDVERERKWDEWANENPGTRRQAEYAPEDYAVWEEAKAQDIQDRARADAVTYGTGNERQLKERVQTGDPVAQDQYDRRVERKQSEDRVIKSDWQTRRRMERLAMRDSGDPAQARSELDAALAERDKGLTPEELFMEKKRRGGNLGRIADQNARRDLVREQAMLAGGQPTGGPSGTRATTNAINELGPGWREVALLDRLTQGRQGGPTPLGVDAANMQNSIPLLRSFLMAGGGQGGFQQPNGQQTLAEQIQLSQMSPEDRARLSILKNEPMGTGLSAAHVGARWNKHVGGGRSIQGREGKVQAFRGEMEGLGYPIEAIDEWIDRRRAADPAAPDAGVTPSPATPPRRGGVSPRGRRRADRGATT